MLIGLCGVAGAGKDTAAQALMQRGYERRAFADKLRLLVELIDLVIQAKGRHDRDAFQCLSEFKRRGGDSHWLKANTNYRDVLQRVGVAVREVIGADTWLNFVLPQPENAYGWLLSNPNVVITDARFMNELQRIKALGGYVVRINRPGYEAANAHVSEHEWQGFEMDAVLVNDGSVAEMHSKLLGYVDSLKPRKPRRSESEALLASLEKTARCDLLRLRCQRLAGYETRRLREYLQAASGAYTGPQTLSALKRAIALAMVGKVQAAPAWLVCNTITLAAELLPRLAKLEGNATPAQKYLQIGEDGIAR